MVFILKNLTRVAIFCIALQQTGHANALNLALSSTLCSQSNLPSYSLGSTGYRLGYSVSNISTEQDTSPYMGGDAKNSSLSRIQFSKGTPLPVNLGFQFGASEDARVFQQGIHFTWSAFESVGLPSINFRYSYDTLKGLRELVINSQTTSVGVEYSPIYWLSFASHRDYHSSSVSYLTNLDIGQWGIRDRALDQEQLGQVSNYSTSYRVQIKPFTQNQIYFSLEHKEITSGIFSESLMISSGF